MCVVEAVDGITKTLPCLPNFSIRDEKAIKIGGKAQTSSSEIWAHKLDEPPSS